MELIKNKSTILLLIILLIVNYFVFSSHNKIITILFITIGTFFLMVSLANISKKIFQFFLSFMMIVYMLYFIAIQMLDEITISNISALYFTDFTESYSYIKVIPFEMYLEAVLIVFPLLLFFKLNLPLIKVKFAFIIIIALIFVSFTKIAVNKNEINIGDIYKTIYVGPFRVLTNIGGFYYSVKQDVLKQEEFRKKPSSWKILKSKKPNKITVFIIGESVRKDFMGTYNPQFNNTPFLNSVKKIQFQNTISFGAHTIQSLTNSLSITNLGVGTNNIVSLAKTVGYQTYWLSNQGIVGVHDSEISAMGKSANYSKFISKGTFDNFKKDEELLDIFKSQLTEDLNSIYFLHTIGSHPSPCDITSNEYSKFVVSHSISCYIESIKRTDSFIKDVYNLLKETKQGFQIIYFSDHGLRITESNELLHHSGFKQSYEVPLLIIDSELSENIYYSKQRNLKDFLLLYQELLNIETLNYKKNYKYISNEIDVNATKLYNNLNYNELKDNKITF